MTSLKRMTSLKTRSLIPCGLIVASLALSGSAIAADASVKSVPAHSHHARVVAHAAPRRHYAAVRQPDDFGQFIQSLFGGGFAPRVSRGEAGSYDWSSSPSVDTSASVDNGAQAAQAASDAEVQAIQQMNDTNAMNASMAAAEQQNDAANAAALQTELNAGN
jgi:hypothetical protein